MTDLLPGILLITIAPGILETAFRLFLDMNRLDEPGAGAHDLALIVLQLLPYSLTGGGRRRYSSRSPAWRARQDSNLCLPRIGTRDLRHLP